MWEMRYVNTLNPSGQKCHGFRWTLSLCDSSCVKAQHFTEALLKTSYIMKMDLLMLFMHIYTFITIVYFQMWVAFGLYFYVKASLPSSAVPASCAPCLVLIIVPPLGASCSPSPDLAVSVRPYSCVRFLPTCSHALYSPLSLMSICCCFYAVTLSLPSARWALWPWCSVAPAQSHQLCKWLRSLMHSHKNAYIQLQRHSTPKVGIPCRLMNGVIIRTKSFLSLTNFISLPVVHPHPPVYIWYTFNQKEETGRTDGEIIGSEG